MKKVILSIIGFVFILFTAMCLSTACNYQVVDLMYNFDYAYIKMPDGSVVEGKVVTWRDYEDGDQLQVTIGNTTYLTHATNVVLVNYDYDYATPSDEEDEIYETTTEGNFEVE